MKKLYLEKKKVVFYLFRKLYLKKCILKLPFQRAT